MVINRNKKKGKFNSYFEDVFEFFIGSCFGCECYEEEECFLR